MAALDDIERAESSIDTKKKKKSRDTNNDPHQVEKKKKKRRVEPDDNSNNGEQTIPVEDVETKKKKRKRDVEDPTSTETLTKEERKERKRRRKAEAATENPATATTSSPPRIAFGPAPISSSPLSASDAQAFLTKHSITIHTSPTSGEVTPVISFDQLAIPPNLRSAFTGFKEPTPIQACAWPPALEGKDVVGIAETGSGKTLAFGIPALARLISSPTPSPSLSKKKSRKDYPPSGSQSGVTVLVVAPTRELAIQTHDTLSALGAPFGIGSVAVYGGVDKGPQVRALAGGVYEGKTTRIVVGTPGRILDLVNDGACNLSGVNYLVLDEADRMLDKGFENDIRAIISHTAQGAERQTLMFSATWPDAVRRLASSFQQDPIRVTVGSDDLTANSRVEQIVEVFDDPRSKDSKLTAQLRALSHKKTSKTGSEEARILIFVLYKKEASRVEHMLRTQGYAVAAIHGDMSQSARIDALEGFKSGKTGLLVATDVAARGLDIPNVGAVINYSFPLTIEDYIHRIGRTGRGGRSGKSITFFTGENHERALAGELARVLRDSGFEAEGLKKFPMTIKKKTHGAYGAFFRDDIPATAKPTKIKF